MFFFIETFMSGLPTRNCSEVQMSLTETRITGSIQLGKLRVSQALGSDGLATVSAKIQTLLC